MDPILIVLSVIKGATTLIDAANELMKQHNQGNTITEAQAEELRNMAKQAQQSAEDNWANA